MQIPLDSDAEDDDADMDSVEVEERSYEEGRVDMEDPDEDSSDFLIGEENGMESSTSETSIVSMENGNGTGSGSGSEDSTVMGGGAPSGAGSGPPTCAGNHLGESSTEVDGGQSAETTGTANAVCNGRSGGTVPAEQSEFHNA